MLEQRSAHTELLIQRSEALRRQFVECEQEHLEGKADTQDPLEEDVHEAVRGLVHKYPNRVLCLLTAECASYCRFCTRRRRVSDVDRGLMTEDDIDQWKNYLLSHHDVTEVIISGGDPFVAPVGLFSYAVKTLTDLSGIKVLRVGTRVVVSAPDLLTEDKLDVLRQVRQPVYVGINFEHPDELTPETIDAVGRLRKSGAILYSQTVFLKGVNDDYDTLCTLFTRLLEIGVRPYYMYRCDPVAGAGHFRVDFRRERSIMTRLRKNLSGLACPTYVIDTPHGSGKIPAPLEFWDVDDTGYRDFNGQEHQII